MPNFFGIADAEIVAAEAITYSPEITVLSMLAGVNALAL
jgi:hypothetical protein